MGSFKPSAPFLPDPSNSKYDHPPPSQAYHVAHENYPSSSQSYNVGHENYPPPSQAYHVSHENYPQQQPPSSQSYPVSHENYPPPSQAYHVSHESHSSSSTYPPSSASTGGNYYGYNPFPPGTDPEVIRSFQMVDRDHSGFVNDSELQQSLSSAYHRFALRTIRLLIFLFKNPNETSLRLGPSEFAALWSCLGQWRAMFERFDRDRSGKINAAELRDAFYGLGYAVPPSVLQLLISRYDDGSGRKVELNFDSFVECGMVIKGLTEKFKEKDPSYTGSATLSYDSFMSMVLPFLVTYN